MQVVVWLIILQTRSVTEGDFFCDLQLEMPLGWKLGVLQKVSSFVTYNLKCRCRLQSKSVTEGEFLCNLQLEMLLGCELEVLQKVSYFVIYNLKCRCVASYKEKLHRCMFT